ncbi:MAG: cation:proton antiporter [Campylobacterales bacterium]|nr:cation:proton antiporter [Campylobacterales bacterium]
MDILTIIVVTLFLSLILNLILKKFHISPIVGYIFTGMIIVSFMDLVRIDKEMLAHIAEYGIVFLMFTIGLEFSVNHLKHMKKEVFVFGSLQVVLTTIFFMYMAHYLFSLDMKTSIVLGAALALSSTAIVLKVLNENGDIHRPYGRNSVGILIFQDLAVIPILLMITILSDSSASISNMLLNTLYSAILVGIILVILGKYVTEKFLAYVTDTHTEELFIASILLIVLSSALLAHAFGFSHSLGAFLAGMLIAETKYKYQIEADLVPFRDILLGVFFITVGMQVNFSTITEYFFTIIALAVAILSLKVVIIFAILRVFTFTKRAFKTALALAQVGEFSFAVFALASSNSLIDDQLNQIMISVVILSLLFTSLALRHVRAFVNLFYSQSSEILDEPMTSAGIKNHIIVCGYSLLGQKIVRNLREQGISYVAIEHDRQHVKTGHDRGDIVFFGNAASKHMLHSMYIKDAIAVIIAIDNDDKVRLIAEAIKDIDSSINVVVKVQNKAQIDEFKDLKIDSFVNENEIVATELVAKATKCVL